MQTAYADLLDRCASAAFSRAFAEDGVFTPKTVRARRYWYFQVTLEDGTRKQRYVGPETPELLERIKTHKEARSDQRDRQALVSTLVRSAHLPRPEARIGQIVEALAEASVFRLRGVLVGAIAYQTYSAMLGIRLPSAAVQTGDVDIAQFKNVSIAVEEKTPTILETLKKVDPSFRAVPHMHNQGSVTSYVAKSGIRVDFLTPNEGPDTDAPARLPALGTDAQQLRFLDFLIHDPEPAVLLYGEGIYVLVPSPQRYAVHKLIVARRRNEGAAKTDKDV
ncbi:MAG: nucleotidyltransferase family protein, partial [Geminicoccaceae bacterium]